MSEVCYILPAEATKERQTKRPPTKSPLFAITNSTGKILNHKDIRKIIRDFKSLITNETDRHLLGTIEALQEIHRVIRLRAGLRYFQWNVQEIPDTDVLSKKLAHTTLLDATVLKRIITSRLTRVNLSNRVH